MKVAKDLPIRLGRMSSPATARELDASRSDRGPRNRKVDLEQLTPPTEAEIASPEFYAVRQALKGWDIAVSSQDGYAGANGSHVMVILNALAWTKDPELCAAFRLGGIEAVKKLQECNED